MIDFKDHGTLLDIEGIFSGIVPAGVTTTFNYTVTYDHYVTGVDYEAIGRNLTDRVDFQVIHPVYGVVGQFADNIFVREKMSYDFYKATIKTGLTIRVIYKNNGINDVSFNLNLISHKDK